MFAALRVGLKVVPLYS